IRARSNHDDIRVLQPGQPTSRVRPCRIGESWLTSGVPKKKQPKAPPQPLTGKQKSHLRALAHPLKPVVQLGHQGLTEGVLAALDVALERHELIKLKVSSEAELKPADIAPQIEKATRSQGAQLIGH